MPLAVAEPEHLVEDAALRRVLHQRRAVASYQLHCLRMRAAAQAEREVAAAPASLPGRLVQGGLGPLGGQVALQLGDRR